MSSAARQFASVDGEDVLARRDVDAGLRQRRLQARDSSSRRCRRASRGSGRSRSRSPRRAARLELLRLRTFAAADEHVADGHLAERFLEQVVEILARGEAVEIRLVLLLDLCQIRVRGDAGRRRSRAGSATPRETSASTAPAARRAAPCRRASAVLLPASACRRPPAAPRSRRSSTAPPSGRASSRRRPTPRNRSPRPGTSRPCACSDRIAGP